MQSALLSKSLRVRQAANIGLVVLYVSLVGNLRAQVPDTDQPAFYPDWWFERGVIMHDSENDPATFVYPTDYAAADDYAAINQGQLKHIAVAGYWELKDKLPDIDWTIVDSPGYLLEQLVLGWYSDTSDPDPVNWDVDTTNADHYAVANLGQVKFIAKHFYDVLAGVGYVKGLGFPPSAWGEATYTAPYPWSEAATDDDNYAAANLGQVKYLFSWDITIDADPGGADGLPDWWEYAIINSDPNDSIASLDDVLPTDPQDAGPTIRWDFDGDGVSNLDEFDLGISPLTSDSDGDGLSDSYEINTSNTNPALADTDNDELSDGFEINTSLTNPLNPDTDGDFMPDGFEYNNGLNPNDYLDMYHDADGDLLAVKDEYLQGSSDSQVDTDSDGLSDYLEYYFKYNPSSNDSDNDGILDGNEDFDGDGLPNLDEITIYATNPVVPDSDLDGASDGAEVSLGYNPNDQHDLGVDSDGDGLTGAQELSIGSNPEIKDTDGDGLADGIEAYLGLDPTLVDSDDDGITDGDEDNDGDNLTNSTEISMGTDCLNVDTDGDSIQDDVDPTPRG